MKKIALAAITVGAVASSQAFVNLNIDAQYQTGLIPNSGVTMVTFTGTVDILNPNYDVTSDLVEIPGLTSGGPFLGVFSVSSFQTYVAGFNPGVDYSGPLFQVAIMSSDLPGLYFQNNSSSGMTTFSEMIVRASDGVFIASDNEVYGVTAAVPEPASMAALGLGLLALARRRKA